MLIGYNAGVVRHRHGTSYLDFHLLRADEISFSMQNQSSRIFRMEDISSIAPGYLLILNEKSLRLNYPFVLLRLD